MSGLPPEIFQQKFSLSHAKKIWPILSRCKVKVYMKCEIIDGTEFWVFRKIPDPNLYEKLNNEITILEDIVTKSS